MPQRTAFFSNALAPFINHFGTNDIIYAWDIMNEPSLATHAGASDIRLFVEACADLITSIVPDARVCFGHFDRKDLWAYGARKCNIAQVHYYDYMETTAFPYLYRFYDRPAATISRSPVIAGQPYELQSSPGLAEPNWTQITNFTGSAGTSQTLLNLRTPLESQAFYRVLTSP